MNRRTLLKLIALNSVTLPFALQAKGQEELSYKHKRLILIELKGGNDGLNTLIPYADPLYYTLRPTIAIDKKSVLPLTEEVGLHPSMDGMKEIYDKGELAVIQGLGYPEPNRSHFRSIEIWDTASGSHEYLDNGWLNTLKFAQKTTTLKGVVLAGEYGPLSGSVKGIIKINNIQGFLQRSKQIRGRISIVGNNDALLHLLETESEIRQSADVLKKSLSRKTTLPFAFQKSNFGKQMATVAELIDSGTDIPFFKVSLGSFDTHTNQTQKHARLLKELSESIATMRKNLIASGEWEHTLIMTYSEFGRRTAENANRGTDHGTAAPHFIAGGSVKGGIYGEHPSLSSLDKNSDLIYTTDFRSVYKSVEKEWFHTSSARLKAFSPLPHLRFDVKRTFTKVQKVRPPNISQKQQDIPSTEKKVSSKNSKASSLVNYLLN